tara:strand:- start:1827 stop:2819 length:993 start_codon:yes stop_codon:yes gene_type:complete
MIHVPIPEIVAKISKQAGLSEKEVQTKITDKIKSLNELVSEEGAAYIIASELGVKIFEDPATTVLKIKDAHIGMRGVELVAKVAQIFETRSFKRDNRTINFVPLMLADETGQIRTTLWDKRAEVVIEKRLKEGDVIRIKGATIKENKYSGKELQITSRTQLEINADKLDVKIDLKTQPTTSQKITLDKPILGSPVLVEGVVANIAEPRFYEKCTSCNRKVSEGKCQDHGKIDKPIDTLILNFVLDDGCGNIRATIFGETGEKLIGQPATKLKELLMEKEINQIATEFIGQMVEAQGTIKENTQFDRTEMTVNRVTQINPKNVAEQLLKEK